MSARPLLHKARRRMRRRGSRLGEDERAELDAALDGLERAIATGTRGERRVAARHVADGVRRHLPRRPLEALREWTIIIAAALVVSFSVKHSVVEPYVVPTRSMDPTLRVGDRIVVSKCAYDVWLPFTAVRLVRVRDPARWDVIVFTTRGINGTGELPRHFVKRVVGLPGETLEIRDGEIVVDGEVVPKPAAIAGTCYYENAVPDGDGKPRYGRPGQTFTVPEGHYFVLGDNSADSLDGRVWGFVPRENVRGRALVRYTPAWPFYEAPVR